MTTPSLTVPTSSSPTEMPWLERLRRLVFLFSRPWCCVCAIFVTTRNRMDIVCNTRAPNAPVFLIGRIGLLLGSSTQFDEEAAVFATRSSEQGDTPTCAPTRFTCKTSQLCVWCGLLANRSRDHARLAENVMLPVVLWFFVWAFGHTRFYVHATSRGVVYFPTQTTPRPCDASTAVRVSISCSIFSRQCRFLAVPTMPVLQQDLDPDTFLGAPPHVMEGVLRFIRVGCWPFPLMLGAFVVNRNTKSPQSDDCAQRAATRYKKCRRDDESSNSI